MRGSLRTDCGKSAYHELMWDLMDHMESNGVIKKPIVFSEPEKAKQSDIADLVFIVRKAH